MTAGTGTSSWATAPTGATEVRKALGLAAAMAVLGVVRLLLDAGHGNQSWSDIVAVAVFAAVALAMVAVVVPRAVRTPPSSVAWTAVALAALSIPILVVFFFSPAPLVLGWGAWFLARTPQARSAGGRRAAVAATIGLTVSVLSVVAQLALTITGWAPGLPRG